MNTKTFLIMMITGGLVLFSNSCTKEKEVEKLVYKNPSDTLKPPSIPGVVNSMDGTWKFDKAHSNVNWETEYYGDHAYLTGKFNNFDIDIDFDAAKYAKTHIKAWVQLSTFNTGEPGRDGSGKCGPKYMGVTYLDPGTDSMVDPLSDTAWFESTETSIYLDKYVAKGTFTFHGVAKTINMAYTFTGITDETSGSTTTQKTGFHGEISIKALSEFGVTSTSIADDVYISVNANYTK